MKSFVRQVHDIGGRHAVACMEVIFPFGAEVQIDFSDEPAEICEDCSGRRVGDTSHFLSTWECHCAQQRS
jgi:hypothetical protein